MTKGKCFKCSSVLQFAGTVGRREECGHCGADVHCCFNCEFYDAMAYNECREPSADRVVEKDRSNFCDFFKLGQSGKDAAAKKDELRSAADALFKKN